jgi:hypothetical protein
MKKTSCHVNFNFKRMDIYHYLRVDAKLDGVYLNLHSKKKGDNMIFLK